MISLCGILLILGRYNYIIEAREYKQAQVDALIAAAQEEDAAASGAGYTDGTYTGSAMGYGGTIELEVVVEDGSITGINILSADQEDAAYFAMAEDIIDDIIDAQSCDVDTITGATFSSTGIRDAAENALAPAQ